MLLVGEACFMAGVGSGCRSGKIGRFLKCEDRIISEILIIWATLGVGELFDKIDLMMMDL